MLLNALDDYLIISLGAPSYYALNPKSLKLSSFSRIFYFASRGTMDSPCVPSVIISESKLFKPVLSTTGMNSGLIYFSCRAFKSRPLKNGWERISSASDFAPNRYLLSFIRSLLIKSLASSVTNIPCLTGSGHLSGAY